MARRDYYPEYYLKKRQKDALFNRVWKTVIVVVIVALGAGAGYLVYKQIVEPRRQPADNTSALAGLKGDLEAQERLQTAASQAPPDDVNEATRQLAQETNLEEIAYVQSFPQVHVSVSGSNEPVNRRDNRGASTGEDEPAEAAESDERGSADSNQLAQREPAGSEESGNDPAQSGGGNDEADKAEEREPAEVKPVAATREYKVYAGSYPTQEDADEGKRGLGALGLTGTIIKNGADYNLLVGTLTDFEAALALRNKLKSSGYGNSFVTRVTR